MERESMAINPPSDLVLDVAMAADPDTLRTSLEKLRSIASDRVAAQMQLSRENFASISNRLRQVALLPVA